VKTTAALVAVLALVLGTVGCSSDDGGIPAASTSSTAATAPADRPTLPEIVADPHATLSAVSVRSGADGLTVRAWWVLTRHGRTRGAIVSGEERMASPSYAPGTLRAWAAREPRVSEPVPAPGMGDLLAQDVLSLRDGTRAQQGGHDGATLDPFERLVRSVSGGPWQRFDVPHTDGQQAYTSGQVVLPDGRLLALLDAWSGDRRGRANPVWHGLWISAGDDWSSYRPWRPRFTPALPAGERPWGPLNALGAAVDPRPGSDPVVWVTTRDRLYVSTDGARTFREIAARPTTS
jgi:hypothetical protein